jgi:hypothetical protein
MRGWKPLQPAGWKPALQTRLPSLTNYAVNLIAN